MLPGSILVNGIASRPQQPHSPPSQSSKTVLSTVYVGGPEEARTPRKDRYGKDHRAPNHISKMVLSTVHFGPPKKTRTGHRSGRWPSMIDPLDLPLLHRLPPVPSVAGGLPAP